MRALLAGARRKQPALLQFLRGLVESESPSTNKTAVDACIALAADQARTLGGRVKLHRQSKALGIHLLAFCRAQGHKVVRERPEGGAIAASPWIADVVRSGHEMGRFRGAERAGAVGTAGIAPAPPATWGLAARGALVEAGTPAFDFALAERSVVWSDEVPRLYAQAAAAQWDPAAAVPWAAPFALPDEVEDAVVQVMTYLVENETAALLVPARFLSRIHPHFREAMQLLAVQIADEARHIEVFTRRATLRRAELGLSTAGGRRR